MEEKKKYCIKYIIIGDSGVGKTNIVYRFVTGKYGDVLENTIGVEFSTKFYEINNIIFKIEIWDTTGMHDFESIRVGYYENVACAIIVYDISKKTSLNNVEYWIEECNKYCKNNKLIKILVGNKSDKTNERKITEEQGKNIKENFSFDFFYETSALNGININKIFIESCKEIYKLIKTKENELPGINKIGKIDKNEVIITLKVSSEKEEIPSIPKDEDCSSSCILI